jgi:hypothetical protein
MIAINFNKAKVIAHENRRQARADEFKPYDDVIMKQIPGNSAVEAEAFRQAIRNKYAVMQTQIDAADTLDKIKAAMP